MQLEPREYSKRLGTLSHAQLQSALARFDLGELFAAEPAPGGLFGQNVFLTSSRGEFVLRGCPHGEDQLPKERFFARLLHERACVPVPWPYRLEPSPEIFGWGFAIVPRLPGLCVGLPEVRKSLAPGELANVAGALGAGLAELHAAVWPYLGEYDLASDDIARIELDYEEWVIARLRARLAECRRASSATTEDDVAWVESIVARSRVALRGEFAPTFVHVDYTEGNALVERTGSGWRVSGVLDLMTGYFGDPEADLVRLLAHYARVDRVAAHRFLDAYQSRRPLRPGSADRLAFYALADSITLWEYGQRNRVWFGDGMCLRDFAQRFVALDLGGVRR